MPPAFRDGTSATGAATSAVLAITKPILQLNDILVFFNFNGARSNPIATFPTTGWTSQGVVNAAGTVNGSVEVATKLVTQAEIDLANFSFTWTTATIKAAMVSVFSGQNTNLPINQYEGISIAPTRAYPAPSVAPTVPDTLILAMWGARIDSATVSSTDTTVVEQAARTNASAGMGTVAGPAGGVESGTKTGTFSGTVDGAGAALTIALAAVPSDTTPPPAPTDFTAFYL